MRMQLPWAGGGRGAFWARQVSGPWLWEASCQPDGCPMGKETFIPGTNL